MGKHYGNLQRIVDGKRKFAITPNIKGGFILPETLEKIAEVTKKYNGVLKLTSGQRILITNLEEEELPDIWDELGMEPAVLSQNSVKNIEMCPAGFCKRVKYNTIGIGMKLYNRYLQMEVPCRTKIGVAGCRNACGSVYSKDIGVISDVNGLLMVTIGGSAGFNPRIADILDRDLNETDTLALIEMLFDYYKENAEPGEKIGFLVERIGLKKLRDDLGIKKEIEES